MATTPFGEWLDSQYTRMATDYRAALARKVAQFHEVTSLFQVGEAHIQIGIEALTEVPRPVIGKYPVATAEDRDYFAQAVKPDWEGILGEYIHKLRLPVTQP